MATQMKNNKRSNPQHRERLMQLTHLINDVRNQLAQAQDDLEHLPPGPHRPYLQDDLMRTIRDSRRILDQFRHEERIVQRQLNNSLRPNYVDPSAVHLAALTGRPVRSNSRGSSGSRSSSRNRNGSRGSRKTRKCRSKGTCSMM